MSVFYYVYWGEKGAHINLGQVNDGPQSITAHQCQNKRRHHHPTARIKSKHFARREGGV